MAYTEEFKENFINEFLDRYQKDPTLSLRQIGIEKFGKVKNNIYLWLSKYDVNKIYKANKNRGHKKNGSVLTNSPIVKISNNKNKGYSNVKANISIKVGNALIEMGSNYSKEDLVLVLSALKEVNHAK